ncbi:cyclodehydratase [Mycobacterium hubeiense]|uniref:cyclodehydratase n=1 Tax=Mycobacterium hubeiense TaxID=1867256 RepID=UPI000C7F25F2|nr:cyclodehydratase [Mycobacterium sp. QGD 101]
MYALTAAMPVLLRPDGTVQVGWDPRRAVLVQPPAGMTASGLAELLRALQSGMSMADVQAEAARRGAVDASAMVELVESLIDSGVAKPAERVDTRTASIRIHGRGPLSDLLTNALRCSGARVARSSQRHAGVTPDSTDLVVLTDYLVADPHVVRELHLAGVPHLPVRVRDGTGLVGPLVIPGMTSCLGCADLHRSDRDAAWPAVSAQLRGRVGTADRATVLATAALALNQVDRVIRAVRDSGDPRRCSEPPPALDTTLEFDVNAGSIIARRWSKHPHCPC